jgi:hypothetical protein
VFDWADLRNFEMEFTEFQVNPTWCENFVELRKFTEGTN